METLRGWMIADGLWRAKARRSVRVRLHDAVELDLILCEHHTRKLTKNLTVSFGSRAYQVTGRGKGYRLR